MSVAILKTQVKTQGRFCRLEKFPVTIFVWYQFIVLLRYVCSGAFWHQLQYKVTLLCDVFRYIFGYHLVTTCPWKSVFLGEFQWTFVISGQTRFLVFFSIRCWKPRKLNVSGARCSSRGRRIRTLNKGFGDPRVTITPFPYNLCNRDEYKRKWGSCQDIFMGK